MGISRAERRREEKKNRKILQYRDSMKAGRFNGNVSADLDRPNIDGTAIGTIHHTKENNRQLQENRLKIEKEKQRIARLAEENRRAAAIRKRMDEIRQTESKNNTMKKLNYLLNRLGRSANLITFLAIVPVFWLVTLFQHNIDSWIGWPADKLGPGGFILVGASGLVILWIVLKTLQAVTTPNPNGVNKPL